MAQHSSEKTGDTQSKPYCVNIFPADSTGCNFYRNLCPQITVQHMVGNVLFNNCAKFMVDDNFFTGVNVNILQRQVNDNQASYYLKYVVPLSHKTGSWIVYNIDDCIHKDDIPKYNTAWDAYQDPNYYNNIRCMLNASDFVLVTTDELRTYYETKFGVPHNNFIVIPNYIPQWWMGHCFNFDKTMKQYDINVTKNHKPRIGIIGSPSHYDIRDLHEKNDITDIAPYIEKTVDKYQWVIFGSVIPELRSLVADGKIEYHRGIDVMHYPDVISSLNLQFIVAPLLDNTFNRCKSNIKLTESWAMGICCAAQNLPAYSKYTDDVFESNDELDALLDNTLKDADTFASKIQQNHENMKDWWLETHLTDWIRLYKVRQKPLLINIDKSDNEKLKEPGVVAPNIKKSMNNGGENL